MVRNSKQSTDLANVQRQLRSGHTRGKNPRPLTDDEVEALEQKRAKLQAEIAEAQHQRSVARINSHTTQEAEQTRAAVKAEGEQTRRALQPITALVVGEGDAVDDRIRIKRNQIALLRAGVREDLAAKKRERERATEGRAEAAAARKAGARGKRPRIADDQATLSSVDDPVEPDQPEEEDLSEPAESDVEEQAMSAQAEASCPKVPAPEEESKQPVEVEEDMQPGSADIAEADAATSDESDSSSSMEEDLSLLVLPLSQPQPEDSTEVGEDPGKLGDTIAEQAGNNSEPVDPDGAAKEDALVRGVVIALGGEPAHVLLRSTACKTVALRADAVLACEAVAEWKGNVDDFGDGYDPLFACVWQDLVRHINYARPRPSADMVKVWTDLHARVEMLGEKTPCAVKVKLAGTPCRGDKLYDVKFAPGTVMHELKN